MRSPDTVWWSLLSLFLVFVPRAMGISDGLNGGYSVDSSVGTIVWVRRRNGSWWPGRILGPNELSASHLMSPRSGTPVKLLGREDASVDWYNLEKSKRVKAFRCGEFDACIERAEASQGIPIKKREKYARREDAILHALELENQQLEMKQKKLVNVSTGITSKTTGVPKIELNNFSSEVYVRNDDPGVHSKYVNHKYQTVSRKAILPHEDDNISNSLYVHKGMNGKQFNWEGDIPESLPRMKGLQEFDLLSAPSKRTLTQSVPWETIPKPADNHVDALSSAGHIIGDAVHTGSCKSSMSIKWKRSQGGMVEESLFRKHERRRPLVHLFQSSKKISHPFQSDYDAGLSIQDEKDLMGVVCRAKRSRCIYLPPDSNDSLDHSGYPYEEMATDDYLHHSASLADEYISSEPDSSERVFWEYDMEAANLLTDSDLTLVPGSEDCNTYRFQIPDEFENMNNDKLPITSYTHQLHPHEQAEDVSTEVGVSRWHMKGKRNSRNLTKRPTDAMDRKIFNCADKYNGSAKGTRHRSMENSFKIGQKYPNPGFYHKKEFNHVSNVGDKNLDHTHFTGYNNRKNHFPVQAAKDHGRSHSSFNDSDGDLLLISRSGREADGPSRAARGSYWEESDECFEPAYASCIDDKTERMLVDVDLKAKASYQGEHVPLVSLMSRLNGKAIIGHPVQIEILEDGYSGAVLSRKITGLDESTEPPPIWRTARRTAMQRVPRSNPVISALEGDDAEPLQYSDCESKLRFTKLYSGHFSRQAKLVKKSISHACRLVSGKSHKKHVKRSLLSSQKTRMLSSIATDRKLRREDMDAKLSRRGDILGRLIKSEAMPLVTCVPVKVVFSRIMEAVGRPSAAAAHRLLMTSPAIRDSS